MQNFLSALNASLALTPSCKCCMFAFVQFLPAGLMEKDASRPKCRLFIQAARVQKTPFILVQELPLS